MWNGIVWILICSYNFIKLSNASRSLNEAVSILAGLLHSIDHEMRDTELANMVGS